MRRILVVDDETLILQTLSAVLKNDGTDVQTAATGADALRAIAERPFDLCFLDINLTDMNGLDIMEKIRTGSPGTKIIMMTGNAVDESTMQHIIENAQLFLSKPFDVFFVKAFVEKIMKKDEHIYREHESFMRWLVDDRRQHERESIEKTISCSAVGPGPGDRGENLKADVIDISTAGIGILTACPLEPGRRVRFNNGMARNTGIVRWSMLVEQDNRYRIGIQFV